MTRTLTLCTVLLVTGCATSHDEIGDGSDGKADARVSAHLAAVRACDAALGGKSDAQALEAHYTCVRDANLAAAGALPNGQAIVTYDYPASALCGFLSVAMPEATRDDVAIRCMSSQVRGLASLIDRYVVFVARAEQPEVPQPREAFASCFASYDRDKGTTEASDAKASAALAGCLEAGTRELAKAKIVAALVAAGEDAAEIQAEVTRTLDASFASATSTCAALAAGSVPCKRDAFGQVGLLVSDASRGL